MDLKVSSIVAAADDPPQQKLDEKEVAERVDCILAAGYSKEEAMEALAGSNDDVDDAIDSLFLKGRKSQGNVASRPTYDDEDVTVTDDSLAPNPAVASRGTNAIVAGQFSQSRRTSNAPASRLSHSLGVAVIDSNRAASVRGNSSAAARHSSSRGAERTSRTLNDVDPEPGLMPPSKCPPRSTYDGKGLSVEETKDIDSIGADTARKSVSTRVSTRSSAHQQRGANLGHRAAARLPGAVAVGRTSVTVQGDIDDWEHTNTSINHPSLREITTAELVDPDQENQILEKRLERELERERENAAVAEVVNESELKTCRWRRVACVVGVVLVALGIALAVALTRPPKTVETPAPTPAPTFSPVPQEIIELIAPVSFDEGESLMDPSSPQSKAARWLADNAHLSNYTDQRKLQRYALATFYYSTNGDAWKDKQNWLNESSNECTDWWVRELDGNEDVKLECDANHAVQYLYIQDNNLAGSLPDEIAFLSNSMFDMRLKKNQIGGTLPPILSLMTRLKAFYLEGNNVTGPIPTEFGLMSSLDELKVNDNLLTGSIPTEMALMTSLDDLRLQSNNLVGTISPTMIGSLRRLDTLRLSGNDFEGSIPTEIGILTLLKELKLHENKLSGPMPSEIGLLSVLEDFNCYENELTGTLPTEMGQMTALEKELRIGSNNFTGPIPAEFAFFTNLGRLRMEKCQLTGTILSTLGLLHPNLKRLELQSNRLTGSIPEELGLLTLMSDLRLHANNLTGTVLSEFTQFTDLKGLHLYNNSFTGTIPPFGNLTRIKYFRAGFNMLTGTIPSSVDRLDSLEQFRLSNNNLTGTIPSVLFNSTIFPNLLEVYLFNNSFTGNATCPPHLVDCYLSCFEEGNETKGNETCRTLS